jgi:hypothetical protein
MSSPIRRITPEAIDDVLVDSDADSDSSFYTKKPPAITKKKKDDPNANQKRSNFNARKSVVATSIVAAASPIRNDPVLASLKRTIAFPLSKENVPDLQVIPRSSDEEDIDDDMISPDGGNVLVVTEPNVQPKRLSSESASSFEAYPEVTQDTPAAVDLIPADELDISNAAPSAPKSSTNASSSGNTFQPSVSELVKTKAWTVDLHRQKAKDKKPRSADVDCANSVAALAETDAQPKSTDHSDALAKNKNNSIQHWQKHIAPILQYCGVCRPCKEKPCGQCRLCITMKGKLSGRVSGQSHSKMKLTFTYCLFKCCVRHYKVENSHTLPVIQWYRDELDYTRHLIEQQLIKESELGPKYFRFQVEMPVYCWWPDSQVSHHFSS